ncbi:MAG: transcriptional regulator [Deltaproteobacteria bacterium HGW-Deltaproteobacteria-2]|jgi:predicted DNA-binding transcriptional regulator AlpA|nr:MAG: transcriptional regulator [Deltaproteobacteria bacterium HGW-Deltaproteobacteria-2]
MDELEKIPIDGFLRLNQIVGRKERKETPREGKPPLPERTEIPPIIPVSKSSWWDGVKTGKYPKSVKLGPNTTVWNVQDIRELIQRISENK